MQVRFFHWKQLVTENNLSLQCDHSAFGLRITQCGKKTLSGEDVSSTYPILINLLINFCGTLGYGTEQ